MNLLRCKKLQWNIEDWHRNILRKAELEMGYADCILDVGCGDGKDCEIISTLANHVVGVDLYLNSLRLPKISNLDFILADACNLPLKNGTLDVVFEKDVLHHILDHNKALKEMKRVVRNGGKLVAVEANRYNPIFYFHMTLMKGHQHFSTKYFKNLLASCFFDFEFKSVESHCYPITSRHLLKIVHFVEDFVAKVPFMKNILSYNISTIKKNE